MLTAIVCEDDANAGLVTPDTATLMVSPAVIFFGTTKVTFELLLASVGVAVTVPEPDEWVLSVIT